ncbi:HAD family hydrolase [Marivita sp. XM-24bin2]|jgi:phosphoglycolate phosphatase|uniref:HAD family hydrolase n=1 Tax=unclassified Marivita TaxID=2632480 RepID=UPI000D7B6F68|nr:HAD family hydrolase [Marivita sp. XM-24bin2]MCR9110557.1 HAD family hydrolase [Paracoccaceae bacterium]PWL35404.1 MAG: phosphatase [Marivita sp. XM-24bin2]
MTQKDIQAILFDKDGTLFDFEATWNVWANTFLMRMAEGDHKRATHLGHLIGFDFATGVFRPDSFVIAGTPDDLVAVLHPEFPEFSQQALADLINEEAAAAPMAEATPLRPLLERFSTAGLRLGVATNDAATPALAHLDAAGIRSSFEFICGSDSGFGSKPEPGPLLAFCNAVNVAPNAVAMVGDSKHDLVAGRAAGMTTVAVLTGLAAAAELEPFADVVLPDIGHLPDWLGLE